MNHWKSGPTKICLQHHPTDGTGFYCSHHPVNLPSSIPIDLLIPPVSLPKMNRNLEWFFSTKWYLIRFRIRPGFGLVQSGDRIQERLIETSMGHLCTSARIKKKLAVESRRAELWNYGTQPGNTIPTCTKCCSPIGEEDDDDDGDGEWGCVIRCWPFSGQPHLVPLCMDCGAGIHHPSPKQQPASWSEGINFPYTLIRVAPMHIPMFLPLGDMGSTSDYLSTCMVPSLSSTDINRPFSWTFTMG